MASRLHRSLAGIAALAAAGSLTLTACSPSEREATRQTGEAMGDAVKDAAGATGEAAKDAATATGQVALAPAVNPVLDLLRKGESELNAGNVAAATATMGGFSALWATAGPAIQPLAGDKWPMIEKAAMLALKTFDKGANPDATAAGSAITGLMGPLNALMGN
jgi:hypothetical protein